jgi:hypothetical protein
MDGGSIIDNSCPNGHAGGAVLAGNATISGGTINNNTAGYDCDILVYNNKTLILSGSSTTIGSIGLRARYTEYGKIMVAGPLSSDVTLDLIGVFVDNDKTGVESFTDWSHYYNNINNKPPILVKAVGWDNLQTDRFHLRYIRKSDSNTPLPLDGIYIIDADGKLAVPE